MSPELIVYSGLAVYYDVYKFIIGHSPPELVTLLNAESAQGWVVVTIVHDGKDIGAFLKKPSHP